MSGICSRFKGKGHRLIMAPDASVDFNCHKVCQRRRGQGHDNSDRTRDAEHLVKYLSLITPGKEAVASK